MAEDTRIPIDTKDDDTPAETEGIPENARIAEVLRWAMSHEVPLQLPPWEDNFCGSHHPCVYAGMVESKSSRPDVIQSMAKRHAEWVVSQMAMMTPASGGKPCVTEFPSRTFYIAVCDTTDHEKPTLYMYVYDLPRTIKEGTPQVKGFSVKDVERHSSTHSSPLCGIRPLALEGFLSEMRGVVRGYLQSVDEKRDRAIEDLKASHPGLVQDVAGDLEVATNAGDSDTSGSEGGDAGE